MKVDDIRVFIPSKNYEISQSFYQALGFQMDYVTDDLSLFENGECSFFLQRFYNEALAKNLILQLSVLDINEAFEIIASLDGFDIKYEAIKTEHWGKVVYLWGHQESFDTSQSLATNKPLNSWFCSCFDILTNYFHPLMGRYALKDYCA